MRFLILVLFIIGGGFHYYKTLGYSNEEVVGGFIIVSFIMSLLVLGYLKIENAWEDFIYRKFNHHDAQNLSWFIPLILFFYILGTLTSIVVKNYSSIFPLFFT